MIWSIIWLLTCFITGSVVDGVIEQDPEFGALMGFLFGVIILIAYQLLKQDKEPYASMSVSDIFENLLDDVMD